MFNRLILSRLFCFTGKPSLVLVIFRSIVTKKLDLGSCLPSFILSTSVFMNTKCLHSARKQVKQKLSLFFLFCTWIPKAKIRIVQTKTKTTFTQRHKIYHENPLSSHNVKRIFPNFSIQKFLKIYSSYRIVLSKFYPIEKSNEKIPEFYTQLEVHERTYFIIFCQSLKNSESIMKKELQIKNEHWTLKTV